MDDVKLRYGVGSENCVTKETISSPAALLAPVEKSMMNEQPEESLRAQAMRLVERIEKREQELFLKEKDLAARADTLVMVDSEREKLEREREAAEKENRVRNSSYACKNVDPSDYLGLKSSETP